MNLPSELHYCAANIVEQLERTTKLQQQGMIHEKLVELVSRLSVDTEKAQDQEQKRSRKLHADLHDLLDRFEIVDTAGCHPQLLQRVKMALERMKRAEEKVKDLDERLWLVGEFQDQACLEHPTPALDNALSTYIQTGPQVSELKALKEKLKEYDDLFKLQHKRIMRANDLYVAAHPKDHPYQADLGQLVNWLMEQAQQKTDPSEEVLRTQEALSRQILATQALEEEIELLQTLYGKLLERYQKAKHG